MSEFGQKYKQKQEGARRWTFTILVLLVDWEENPSEVCVCIVEMGTSFNLCEASLSSGKPPSPLSPQGVQHLETDLYLWLSSNITDSSNGLHLTCQDVTSTNWSSYHLQPKGFWDSFSRANTSWFSAPVDTLKLLTSRLRPILSWWCSSSSLPQVTF